MIMLIIIITLVILIGVRGPLTRRSITGGDLMVSGAHCQGLVSAPGGGSGAVCGWRRDGSFHPGRPRLILCPYADVSLCRWLG